MKKNDCEELYYRHADEVYRMAFLFLRNTADAEDAVTEVFLRYLHKQPAFHDHEHEKAWLLTVTANYCRDQLRKVKYAAEDIDAIPDQPMEQTDKHVIEEVLSLPVKFRQVIYLYYYEGYSVREISHMTGVKESTLQSRLAEARRLLKMKLEEAE